MSERYELDSITKGMISRMDLAELLRAKITFMDKYESAYYDEICAELKRRRDQYESSIKR
jgi:hypothetical protein